MGLLTRCSTKCRAKLKPVLHTDAVLCALSLGGASMRVGTRGIHFVPGPASEDEQERVPPSRGWYPAAYARLLRLAGSLQGVDLADGDLRDTATGSLVTDAHAVARVEQFDAIAGEFAATRRGPPLKTTALSSLTKVCDVLGVSAQRRKNVRLSVCPQVTQHHVWRGALEEVLRDLRADMGALEPPSPAIRMAEQIASACASFLSETADAATSSSPSWMRPAPYRRPSPAPPPAKTWQEVLDMFTDLGKSLATDERLARHTQKVEAMKEGLYQIRDIIVERDIAFKEARHQDCLVQRNLSKNLGHSSRGLYTLLLFYLYGTVRDIEVHLGKRLSGKEGKNVTLHAVKFLIDGDELAVRSGIKQLSRALRVFRFVWEAANTDTGTSSDIVVKKGEGAKGVLKLQGHLWGLGVEEKAVTYRGDVFQVHQIKLP
ncbi:uncharacterized protein LOC123447892 [Hordeum vulgare subsp. vulgare]|uniref:Uncharacterized protein n=1 Tax=Hordeum vulgare subsp. vulgare TaxID=112509 RepID=A0A8I6XGB1_HORVV|nr:uncharacterized protein LOC123447892 [Hordeum vulgare subsp. vulgare]